MIHPAPTPCVVFDVDGTLAEFDADRLGHLVHGVEKHWDYYAKSHDRGFQSGGSWARPNVTPVPR